MLCTACAEMRLPTRTPQRPPSAVTVLTGLPSSPLPAPSSLLPLTSKMNYLTMRRMKKPARTRWRCPKKKLMRLQSKPRKRRLCPKLPLNRLLAKITHLLCIRPPDPVLRKNNIVKFPRYAGWELYQYI